MPKSILIVPCIEHGHGSGHLCRCIKLTHDLRNINREVLLYIHIQSEKTEKLLESMNCSKEWIITNKELNNKYKELTDIIDFIILDRFKTPHNELLLWKKIAPVIGIDEGGSSRDTFDFLIDILVPKGFLNTHANISSPALLFNNNLNIDIKTECSYGLRGSQLKNKVHSNVKIIQKILVTFGQEDSAGLGKKISLRLNKFKNRQPMEITLLRGIFSGNINQKAENDELTANGIQVIEYIPRLAERLCEYDLVITHYGITAYEALFAGTPVLLAHPTKYHKKLAKAAGFKTFTKEITQGTQRNIENAEMLFDNPSSSPRPLLHCRTFGSKSARNNLKYNSLADLINSFAPLVNRYCPLCGANIPEKSITRFNDRTYRRCSKCGIIFMDRICPPAVEYSKEYFFESYVKQYGKTYLEDFENIKNAGKNRLKIISKFYRGDAGDCKKTSREDAEAQRSQSSETISNILNKKSMNKTKYFKRKRKEYRQKLRVLCVLASLRDKILYKFLFLQTPGKQRTQGEEKGLLDIGCAYGPFLAAAKEEGFSPFGIDPAEDAVNYVKNVLGIPAVNCFFPSPAYKLSVSYSQFPVSFDVITLWYVIEHFHDCIAVFTEIKKLLKPNGILAFSTPSYSGISGRSSLQRFLSLSPADHFTVWSPKSAKKALLLAGFKVKKIIVVGHHPQRFPVLGKYAKNKKNPLYFFLLAISKLFGLGDTFEVYAQYIHRAEKSGEKL